MFFTNFLYYTLFNRQSIFNYTLIFFAVTIVILVHVHHCIIALLGLQRFLLYFFKKLETRISLKEKSMKWVIYSLYILLYSTYNISGGVYKYLSTYKNQGDESVAEIGYNMYLIYYLMINIILLVSASLYIPISVSVHRLAKLSSSVTNKPHRYILNQTISTVSFKSVSRCMASDIFCFSYTC
ncbi:hypothetical protein CRE_05019 [Caenorhabditis remanei]|uniref:Serpentine receptor class gamma n=1 Tax=Caenorhabditis remanei TaxID=31234 RepID=E3MZ15_CAERE|nr:hypothetical protein CRE_05019 [Caenorhabditis remanei]